MKVIIAGSRKFNDLDLLTEELDRFHSLNKITEVVCGGAKGADQLGEDWALSRNIPVKVFWPNWDKFGRSAGPIRNKEMGDYADSLIAFWDGKSRGTKNMIEYMTRLHKLVKIVKYETST
jgi:hypothetical protein